MEKAGWSFEAVDGCGKFRKARLKLKVLARRVGRRGGV
jgi:hypothetical protein